MNPTTAIFVCFNIGSDLNFTSFFLKTLTQASYQTVFCHITLLKYIL